MTLFKNDSLYGGKAKTESGGGQKINNQDIAITENGVYTADEGYTGIGTATVNVTPQLTTLNATTNGTYTPESPNVGYSSVVVNTPLADIIEAKNATGSNISSGDKVFIEKKAANGTRDFSVYQNTSYSYGYSINDTLQIISFNGGSNANYLANTIYKAYSENFSTPTRYIEFKTKLQCTGYNGENEYPNTPTITFCGDYFNSSYPYVSFPRIKATCFATGNYANRAGLTIQVYTEPKGSALASYHPLDQNNITANAWYWVKVYITNTTIECSYSTDGENWISLGTTNGSGFLQTFASHSKCYSINTPQKSRPAIIDLSETYVKADDEYWWKPYLNSEVGWNLLPSSYMSVNSLTGFATENIATDAYGEVKTTLPEEISVDLYADAENPEISVA